MARRKRGVRRHPSRMASDRGNVANGARPPASVGLTTGRELDAYDHYARVLARVGPDGWDLAWGSMVYACQGDVHGALAKIRAEDGLMGRDAVSVLMERGGAGCGFERRLLLCIGVEGPGDLRDERAFIPAPANAGRCLGCGHGLAHVRWNEDEIFTRPRRPRPDEAHFRVPNMHKAKAFAERGYGGAELVEPRA